MNEARFYRRYLLDQIGSGGSFIYTHTELETNSLITRVTLTVVGVGGQQAFVQLQGTYLLVVELDSMGDFTSRTESIEVNAPLFFNETILASNVDAAAAHFCVTGYAWTEGEDS